MSTTHEDLGARMIVVESAVERLEKTVNTLAMSMQKYIESQANQPRAIPFKEIVLTAAATLTIFGGILTFLDNRTGKDIAFVTFRIEKLEEKLAPKHVMIQPGLPR